MDSCYPPKGKVLVQLRENLEQSVGLLSASSPIDFQCCIFVSHALLLCYIFFNIDLLSYKITLGQYATLSRRSKIYEIWYCPLRTGLNQIYKNQGVVSSMWISIFTVSPTISPPPSKSMFHVSPNSFLAIVVLPSNPIRFLPKGSVIGP